jgi:translocation and assembly module TamB
LLKPTGNWPLNIEGQTASRQWQPPWTLALKVDGDLLKTLNLHADSRGYLDGEVERRTATAGGKPAGQSAHHQRCSSSRAPICRTRCNSINCNSPAKGDLKKGYQFSATPVCRPSKARWRWRCKARSTPRARKSPALDLTANDKQSLKLTGKLDWSKGLERQRQDRLAGFSVASALPVIDEPQVSVAYL